MKKNKLNFHTNMRKVREFLGHSQSDLANMSGLQPSAIAHLEAGRREPALRTLMKIKKALGVSYEKLID